MSRLCSVDVACVWAPALRVGGVGAGAGALAAGPALELNLLSDCALELSLEQLALAATIASDLGTTIRDT